MSFILDDYKIALSRSKEIGIDSFDLQPSKLKSILVIVRGGFVWYHVFSLWKNAFYRLNSGLSDGPGITEAGDDTKAFAWSKADKYGFSTLEPLGRI